MKHGQTVTNIIPLRREKQMPPLDEFPEDIQQVVYDIIANALIRNSQEKEAS